MKTCPRCAMEISEAADMCPHCHKTLTTSAARIAWGTILALAAIIGLGVLLSSCGGSSSPTEPAPTPTPFPTATPTPVPFQPTLSGTVTLVEANSSRSPAVGARVQVTGFGIQTATTDASGRYSFPAVPSGGLPFQVSPPTGAPYSCPQGTLAVSSSTPTVINFDCPHF